jgi:PAS domain S-box-containing protein
LFKSKHLRKIFFISCFLVICVLSYNSFFVYPRYLDVSQKYVSEYSATIAKDIMFDLKHVLYKDKKNAASLEKIKYFLQTVENIYKLYSIKYYSKEGVLLFSTKTPYNIEPTNETFFYTKVSKGKLHFYETDVLANNELFHIFNAYVPLMQKDKFFGALKISVDVTFVNKKLNRNFINSTVILTVFLLSLLVIIFTVLLNISRHEKKRNDFEKQIVESEKKYRNIIENLHEDYILYKTDNKNNLILISPAVEKILGRTQEELSESFTDNFFTKSTSNTKAFHHIEMTRRGIKQPHFDAFIMTKNGEKKIFDVVETPSLDEYGNVISIEGIARDITVQKNIEIEVKKLSLGVEQSSNIVVVTDLDGIVTYVNQAFKEITGFSASEAIGKKTNILSSGYHSNDFYKNMWETISSGREWVGNIKNKKKDGVTYWEEAKIKQFTNSEGEPIGYIAVKEDITKRIELEEEREMLITELGKANNELKALMSMKEEFFSVASHDLRTPFNGILGFSELLLEEATLTTDQREYVEIIKDSAELQLHYVNSLLDVIKLEAGEMKINKTSICMHDLVLQSTKTLKVLAEKKNIIFTYVAGCQKCGKKVFADGPKVIQVLNNLIANSIKFTHAGGQIRLWCLHTKDNKYLEFHIKDTGIGIPKDRLSDIFSRFKQAHVQGTNKEQGTGLGLAICKNIVEIHGGKIYVESVEGKGSDFYFTLPFSED